MLAAPSRTVSNSISISALGAVAKLEVPVVRQHPAWPWQLEASSTNIGTCWVFQPENGAAVVVTAAHVVANVVKPSEHIKLSVPEDPVPYYVKVSAFNAEEDVALLEFVGKRPEKLRPLRLARAMGLEPGSTMSIAGWPMGAQRPMVVEARLQGHNDHMMVVDGAINPGMSGGPLVALVDGTLMCYGIVSFGLRDANNMTFARIPEVILAVWKSSRTLGSNHTGVVPSPYLGLVLADTSENIMQFKRGEEADCRSGALVTWVGPASPLVNTVNPGDIICSVVMHSGAFEGTLMPVDDEGNVKTATGPVALSALLATAPLGDQLTLFTYDAEGNKMRRTEVTLSDARTGAQVAPQYPWSPAQYCALGGYVFVKLLHTHLAAIGMPRDDLARDQVVLSAILGGSLAAKQPLRAGSVVGRVNGRAVGTVAEVRQALQAPLARGGESDEWLVVETDVGDVGVLSMAGVLKHEGELMKTFRFDSCVVGAGA